MISARIVADSKNTRTVDRITSFVCVAPRIILAELNTHRMFSRNSASSRAISFEKMVQSVTETPFIPIAWQRDHKGMQGSSYFTDEFEIKTLETIWLKARHDAMVAAKLLSGAVATKQLCNRLLEPFMYHTVIITATEFENFFALRCPQYSLDNVNFHRSKKDAARSWFEGGLFPSADPNELDEMGWRNLNRGAAEIHMMELAELMWDAYNESLPRPLFPGEWHIPFEAEICEQFNISQNHHICSDGIPVAVKIGCVMAARTSYTVIGTDMADWTIEKYVQKSDEMATAKPLHASPFEHCGQAAGFTEYDRLSYQRGLQGNFKGFFQYRKMLPNENVTLKN